MDKTTRIILGFAIAIIYPVLIVLTVTQIVPKPNITKPVYPTSSNYSECGSRYTSRYQYGQSDFDQELNYTYDSRSYERCTESLRNEFNKKQEAYDKEVKENNIKHDKYEVTRFSVILIISLLSIIVSYFIRNIRELAGGIAMGSTVMITISTTAAAAIGWDLSSSVLINLLILVGFVVTVALLWLVEKNFDNPRNIVQKNNVELENIQVNNNSNILDVPTEQTITNDSAHTPQVNTEEKQINREGYNNLNQADTINTTENSESVSHSHENHNHEDSEDTNNDQNPTN